MTLWDFLDKDWWLLIALGWAAWGAYIEWLNFRRGQDAIALMQTFAAQGREPPPEIIAALARSGSRWATTCAPVTAQQAAAKRAEAVRAATLYSGITTGFIVLAMLFWNVHHKAAAAFLAMGVVFAAVGVAYAYKVYRLSRRARSQ